MRGLKGLNALFTCAAALLLTAAMTRNVSAQTYTWTGTADGNWSDPLNWGATGVPVSGVGTVVQFNAVDPVSYTATNDLPDNPFVLNGLTLNNTGTGVIAANVNNTFQLAGANPAINMSGSGAAVIASGSNGFIFDGANPFKIGGTGTGTLTLGGQTDNNVLTGAGDVTVNFATVGSATNPNLLLGNVGSWNGNLNIQSGYVKANRAAGDLFGNTTILNVAAGSTFDFANNGEGFGGLQGAGTIVLGSAGMQFLAAGDRTFTGSIGGTGGVDQSGGGVFGLGGSNSYTGTTTVGGGVIRALNANALSAGSVVTITAGQGGVLDLNNFNQTIAGLTGGQVTGAGVTLGSATLTITNTGTRVYNGYITGSGGLVVGGSGTQILTGPNTYTGATTVNGGTLRTQGAGLLLGSGVTVASGATIDTNFDADATWTVPLTGAGTFAKSGVGSLTFAAANAGAAFTGLTVNNGAVVLDYSTDAGGKVGNLPALTLASGALNLIGNGAAATNQAFNGVTLTGGAAKVNVTNGNNQNATAALGLIARNNGSTLNIGLNNVGGGAASVTTSTANLASGILGGWATVNGRDWAVAGGGAGPFAIAPLPAGSYVNNALTAGNHADVTSSVTAPSGSTAATVRFNATAANKLTLAGTNNLTNGGILVIAGGVTWIFAFVMTLFEILVQFLQAYVFTLLAALYIGGAVADEH